MPAELNEGELTRAVSQSGTAIRRIAIFGAGLIGASLGLALREAGFSGALLGWDPNTGVLAEARAKGAIDPAIAGEANDDPFVCALAADVIVLAGPVLSIADWLEQLAPVLSPAQLVTDVGSVKSFLVERAGGLYNGVDSEGKPQAGWLPGHPMAGKEQAGPAFAEAGLFQGATWLFTGATTLDTETLPNHPYAAEWISWIERAGARTAVLSPKRHDLLCASVSHLPQMLASALAALLQARLSTEFATEREELPGVGGRALREMTRLGASPYSMWRDIAMTNEPAIAAALLALEQELAHMRENLKTPELRVVFEQANAFRTRL